MANRIRLGIIGTCDWVELMYLTNLSNRSDVRIAAIAGRNPARLAEMAAKYSIAATFSAYRQLIANGGIDAVVVATPDDQHPSMTLAAAITACTFSAKSRLLTMLPTRGACWRRRSGAGSNIWCSSRGVGSRITSTSSR